MSPTDNKAKGFRETIEALLHDVGLPDVAQVAAVDEHVVRRWVDGHEVPTTRQHEALTALEEALGALARVGVAADQARDWLFEGRAATTGDLAPAQLLATDPYRVLAAMHELTSTTQRAHLLTSLRGG